MNFCIGFKRSRWVECSVFNLNACLSTPCLPCFVHVVFKGEKERHVIRAHFFFASTTWSELIMNHRLGFQILPHLGTLHVNRLRNTVRIRIVGCQINLHIVCCFDINFEHFLSFGRGVNVMFAL